MKAKEQAQLLRSAASALEHGRHATAFKKLNQVLANLLGPPIVVVEGG